MLLKEIIKIKSLMSVLLNTFKINNVIFFLIVNSSIYIYTKSLKFYTLIKNQTLI